MGVSFKWDSTYRPEFAVLAKGAFVFFACCGFILSNYVRYFFQQVADKARRLSLLNSAFNVSLTHHQTKGYYNNSAPPSLRRLHLMICENTFFYSRLLEQPVRSSAILTATFLLAVLASLRWGSVDVVELFAVAIFFSDVVVGRFIRQVCMKAQFLSLFEKAFQSASGRSNNTERSVAIIEHFAEYEAIKARYAFRPSHKHFERMNPRLSEEWARLEGVLQKGDTDPN